ncbi:hypothetical protein [Cohnella nanjingensis]|uniref:DUF11 domain-containing protein n=1 Tax=Cohnella nanjingensis TaxID=1387779 RepID=A0A7X0RXJ9_9BACL|nr:hypothetical protein [Cohnella nanjingensis]MBB6675498.1 hypothetical protein [Cohnella nanjingensis]
MLKKLSLLLLGAGLLPLLLGAGRPADLEITSVETNVIKTQRILRYDFKIRNLGDERIAAEEYPGNHPSGLEINVIPNAKLAAMMEVRKGKYDKMTLRGAGVSGSFEPGRETVCHVEYQIGKDADLSAVASAAIDASLYVLDGTSILARIPLATLENRR